MDGVSSAASIVALVDVAAKVTSIIFQYSKEVIGAKADIDRLGKEIENVRAVYQSVKEIVQRPSTARRLALPELEISIQTCLELLSALEKRLRPSKSRKIMGRVGLRELKWPFESTEIDHLLKHLDRCKQTAIFCLQMDQTSILLSLDVKADLDKIPFAKGAAFDSKESEYESRCLKDTRVELIQEVENWFDDPLGACIYWLNGMAGTGKSTISRTMSEIFSKKGNLGASFFFKRGESSRGNATLFFTTLVSQLVYQVPDITAPLQEAMREDQRIFDKGLREQFNQLVLKPLSLVETSTPRKLIIIVDALDECENDEDVCAIINHFSKMKDLKSISIRIFLTSRPELPIRLGFKRVSGGIYQDLVLHDVPTSIVQRDIFAFLQHEFAKIRIDNDLPQEWPGEANIHQLADMSVPLFIFAATVCRFVADPLWEPADQLNTILSSRGQKHVSQLDKVYEPILDHIIHGKNGPHQDKLIQEFRNIVGSIVILENPLSAVSLSNLLDIPKQNVTTRLKTLHSVLHVPESELRPIKLLHLSFRDFLVDPQRHASPYWVNPQEIHQNLASNCLDVMSRDNGLRKDMCKLQAWGTLRSEVTSQAVNHHLSPELQYACRYWTHHLKKGHDDIGNWKKADVFFRKHLLHWLEALSLMGHLNEAVKMIDSLEPPVKGKKDENENLRKLIGDIRQFVLYNGHIIDEAPLQVYYSSILFCPEGTMVRTLYETELADWVIRKPHIRCQWSPISATLNTYPHNVIAVAFSPDGSSIASIATDNRIRIWDVKTGEIITKFDEAPESINLILFSQNGLMLTSCSNKGTVRYWDVATGFEKIDLKLNIPSCQYIRVSSDRQVLSLIDENLIRIWDMVAKAETKVFSKPLNRTDFSDFSLEGHKYAHVPDRNGSKITLWDMQSDTALADLECNEPLILHCEFSPDRRMLASSLGHGDILLWEVETATLLATLHGHGILAFNLLFSPDSKLLASSLSNGVIEIYNVKSMSIVATLGDYRSPLILEFSPDGQTLALSLSKGMINLWNFSEASKIRTSEQSPNQIKKMRLLPNGKKVVLQSMWGECNTYIWGISSVIKAPGYLDCSNSMPRYGMMSPDGNLLATYPDFDTVCLWDTEESIIAKTIISHDVDRYRIAMSQDGKMLAIIGVKNQVEIWNTSTQTMIGAITVIEPVIQKMFFSLGSHLLGVHCINKTWLCDSKSASIISTVEHTEPIDGYYLKPMVFSPDGSLLASSTSDGKIEIWDTKGGILRTLLDGEKSSLGGVAISWDGSLLASSVSPNLEIWDIKTSQLLKEIEIGCRLEELEFSKDGSSLSTTMGTFDLRPYGFPSTLPVEAGNRTFVGPKWITRNGERLLSLPPDYQVGAAVTRDDLVILGHNCERLTIMEFKAH